MARTDPPADAAGRRALVLVAASIVAVAASGLLGPSVAQPPLPGGGGWPPYEFSIAPDPWLVTTLLLVSVGLGAGGLVLGLTALRQGWAPPLRRLVGAGSAAAVLLVLVPPMGSADALVYAAYGRLVATGDDPYRSSAADLAAAGDPVGRAVEAPWVDTPSVYGPLATAEQWLAAEIAGPSVHRIVFLLSAAGAVAYVLTTALLLALAGPDAGRRRRVALMWSVNPLLLATAVNGVHLDVLGVAAVAAALLIVRRSAMGAGALVAAACAIKLTFGLAVLALIWALRDRPRRLATLLGAGLVVGAGAYAAVGWHALDQARAAAGSVSFASPWRLVVAPLERLVGAEEARAAVGVLAVVAFGAVAMLLARALPSARASAADGDRPRSDHARSAAAGSVCPGGSGWGGSGSSLGSTGSGPSPGSSGSGSVSDGVDRSGVAVRAVAVLALGWLLTAPYSLPWYDVLAWAPFALLAPSRFDRVLLARTTVVAAAYLPGRAVGLPPTLEATTGAVRGVLAPVALAIVAAVAITMARSARTPAQNR